MEKLVHAGGNSFTREFALASDNNRLATLTIGTTVYDYTYDVNATSSRETTSRHFEWTTVIGCASIAHKRLAPTDYPCALSLRCGRSAGEELVRKAERRYE